MKVSLDFTPTTAQLAEVWCELSDDDQAQFFIECGRIMATWPAVARGMQAHSIGRHLKECSCSTYEARQLVREIAAAAGDP